MSSPSSVTDSAVVLQRFKIQPRTEGAVMVRCHCCLLLLLRAMLSTDNQCRPGDQTLSSGAPSNDAPLLEFGSLSQSSFQEKWTIQLCTPIAGPATEDLMNSRCQRMMPRSSHQETTAIHRNTQNHQDGCVPQEFVLTVTMTRSYQQLSRPTVVRPSSQSQLWSL